MFDFLLSLIKKKYDYEKLYKPYIQYFSFYLRKFNREFYVGLAAAFLVYIAYTLVLAVAGSGFKAKSYDLAMQTRLSSPVPSESILIVDIDEKSIAHFSSTLGRWPWPRETLAEAIAGIEDLGASTIYLNLLLAEPDLSNKNSDAVFESVVGSYKNIVLPWVRLNPDNDTESLFPAQNIPGYIGSPNTTTVALIPSMFTDGAGNHGFSNLHEDKDGLIRRFKVAYPFGEGYVPSAALVAARVHLKDATWLPKNEILLNWRNKRGNYERISFADLWSRLQEGDPTLKEKLAERIVILGVSAPGIANLKPTAASALVDDNVIVATAIDDIVSQSYVRMLPQWIDGLISAVLIVAFCLSFVVGSYFKKTGLIVSSIQGVLASITLGFISYTYFFVDLTQSIGLSLSFFGLCKLHQALDTRASRAEKLFAYVQIKPSWHAYSLIVFNHKKLAESTFKRFKRQLEVNLGPNAVYYFDNVYDCTNLLETSLKGLAAILIFTEVPSSIDDMGLKYQNTKGRQCSASMDVDGGVCFVTNTIDGVDRLDNVELNKKISKDLLGLSLDYLG